MPVVRPQGWQPQPRLRLVDPLLDDALHAELACMLAEARAIAHQVVGKAHSLNLSPE